MFFAQCRNIWTWRGSSFRRTKRCLYFIVSSSRRTFCIVRIDQFAPVLDFTFVEVTSGLRANFESTILESDNNFTGQVSDAFFAAKISQIHSCKQPTAISRCCRLCVWVIFSKQSLGIGFLWRRGTGCAAHTASWSPDLHGTTGKQSYPRNKIQKEVCYFVFILCRAEILISFIYFDSRV